MIQCISRAQRTSTAVWGDAISDLLTASNRGEFACPARKHKHARTHTHTHTHKRRGWAGGEDVGGRSGQSMVANSGYSTYLIILNTCYYCIILPNTPSILPKICIPDIIVLFYLIHLI